MRAREADSARHASLLSALKLYALAPVASLDHMSSCITHSSSDSIATMTSFSPASDNAASNSSMLWMSRERSRTRLDSASRRDCTESYIALQRMARA